MTAGALKLSVPTLVRYRTSAAREFSVSELGAGGGGSGWMQR